MKNFRYVAAFCLLAMATAIAPAQNALEVTTPSAQFSDKWTVDGTREKLEQKATDFLGLTKGPYVNLPDLSKSGRTLVSSQFNNVFGGIPSGAVITENGDILYAAKAAHNADEMAAMITDPSSQAIRAIALVHYNCGANNGRSAQDKDLPLEHGCDHRPTMTIFFPHQSPIDENVRDKLIDWMKKEITARNVALKNSSRFLRIHNIKVQIRKVKQ